MDNNKVESCDFVVNGISQLRRKMDLSKSYMKVLDKKLLDLQREINQEKHKEYDNA